MDKEPIRYDSVPYNKTDYLIRKYDVQLPTEDTDHGKNSTITNTNNNITTNNVDEGKEGTEETNKDDTVANNMNQIILTKESFLQFIDKDFDQDIESNEESFINNRIETAVGEDTSDNTASTSKKDPTYTKIDNNRVQGSTPKGDNDALLTVISARNLKLAAMKR